MADSFIDSAILAKSQESVRPDQPLTLSLSFKIQGSIRDAFSQKNWERAYNKHDTRFLMKIEIDLKSGRRRIAADQACKEGRFVLDTQPQDTLQDMGFNNKG